MSKKLAEKEAYYKQELEDARTRADSDLWQLRRKFAKLDEASCDRQQQIEDKHREELGRYAITRADSDLWQLRWN